MTKQTDVSTRDKIMKAAAKLFSERGYDRVSTREIAAAIGINSASIYYHFPSKEDILRSLYYFYSEQRSKECPDLGELLRLAKTDPPHEVLMKSEFHYNEDVIEILNQILITAARRYGADNESEQFIKTNIFGPIANILKPLLEYMVELKKIKPFDIDTFIGIVSYYCFGAAALNRSVLGQDVAKYQSAMSHMYSWITHIEDTDP